LPEIVEILGPRPYPFKASIKEYLEELKERNAEDEKLKQEKEAEKANDSDTKTESTA
jgi:hypothetical protein